LNNKIIETRNTSNQLHSFDDEPSYIVTSRGDKAWHKDGKLHRDNDKPAIIYGDGSMSWYKDDMRHRDSGGPAYIIYSSTQLWFINHLKLTKEQVVLLKKINESEIKYLPWLFGEDPIFDYLIEKRMNLGI
jgi:hypothetical protein